jgi:hypothetical protein
MYDLHFEDDNRVDDITNLWMVTVPSDSTNWLPAFDLGDLSV